MSRYDEIKQLIADNHKIVRFADFGDGIDQKWIDRAEEALGFSLPESYKWWLRNFGGGEIGGEEIFSIYGPDFPNSIADNAIGGDIVRMYRLQSKIGDRIPICHSDVDGLFSFDKSLAVNGEYPVIAESINEIYAKDFLEFIKKRIIAFSMK